MQFGEFCAERRVVALFGQLGQSPGMAALVRGTIQPGDECLFDLPRIAALTPRGVAGVTVFGLTPAGTAAQIEVRSFAPSEGVPEDPVCGSGNGCVAALVKQERLLAGSSYTASQGRCMGRDGRVEVLRFDPFF